MICLDSVRGRRLFFALLYFNEGAPIGFLWLALPTILRSEGFGVDRIAELVSLLMLPWTLKFLWAPVLDRLGNRPGKLLQAIASCQFFMGLTLLLVTVVDLHASFSSFRFILLLHAFVAATQDVAIDALAIRRTSPIERGELNGAMQTGMILGRSVFGGTAIVLASWLGWQTVCIGIVLLQWLTMILVMGVEDSSAEEVGPAALPFMTALFSLLARSEMIYGLVFAVIAGCSFEAVGLLSGPFLLDRGVRAERIGAFQGILVPLAVVGGSLLGGWAADRVGHRLAAGIGLSGICGAILFLVAFDEMGMDEEATLALGFLTLMYAFIGMFTVSTYALFMDLTDRRHSGTQFSAFMAATNGCELWSGWLAGRLVVAYGYGAAFVVA